MQFLVPIRYLSARELELRFDAHVQRLFKIFKCAMLCVSDCQINTHMDCLVKPTRVATLRERRGGNIMHGIRRGGLQCGERR